jgi:hypothetical protein
MCATGAGIAIGIGPGTAGMGGITIGITIGVRIGALIAGTTGIIIAIGAGDGAKR